MASDSIDVLAKLVRTNLWAEPGNILHFQRFVVDVDSVITFFYRQCISGHVQRLKSISDKHQPLDLYSATLVNYIQFSNSIKQFLDFFASQKIQLHLVYQGKFMEAPLYGLLAAQFKQNTQKVGDSLATIRKLDSSGPMDISDVPKQISRPNLALNIFKSIVNLRRKTGSSIFTHQAFYSSYPLMARLARDFKCPVLTNNGDFILVDVRQGFVLVDEVWHDSIDSRDLVTRMHSRKTLTTKPTSASSLKSNLSLGSRKPAPGNNLNFHYNSLFLRQHPGLTQALALHLFPMTSMDFVITHSKSLQRLKVYENTYTEKDFTPSNAYVSRGPSKSLYFQHHKAAERLEMALRFLCGKTLDLIGNFIRGEAKRINSSFDDDLKYIFDYYTVAFEFKARLRFILKYARDPVQLNYIEWCLVNRECTADYLLDVLCCSIGHLASVNYNRFMQFEDLKTKKSAHSLLSSSKSMLMSLFSANKSHKSEHSVSLSKKQQDTVTRYSTAALTVVDRQEASLVERTITTTHEDAQVDALREKLQFSNIAKRQVAKSDCVKFINLVFRTPDITKPDKKIVPLVTRLLGNDENCIRSELSIVMSLFRYSYATASLEDKYFLGTYEKLKHSFEVAILNHYLYINESSSKVAKRKELVGLIDMVNRFDYSNISTSSVPRAKGKTSSPRGSAGGGLAGVSKQIRHLIESLGASLEAYCELNAFFDYPLPRLNLHLHYNPILLYNFTVYLTDHGAGNKVMLTF